MITQFQTEHSPQASNQEAVTPSNLSHDLDALADKLDEWFVCCEATVSLSNSSTTCLQAARRSLRQDPGGSRRTWTDGGFATGFAGFATNAFDRAW